jgi:IMP dehydrogenase
MTTVNDILVSKEQLVYTVNSETTVEDALKLMADQQIGAVVVVDGTTISGIFSERDFARKTLTIEGFHLGMTVKDLMSTPVYFVHPTHSLENCMNIMTEKRIRHIPVLKDDELIGIVSIRDLVKWLIADKSFEISELERFVSSHPEEG